MMSESPGVPLMHICPVCKKKFFVLYPHLWRYIRGTASRTKYFCKWSCLREYDKRTEEKPVVKITQEQRMKAVELALNDESPVKYLESLGAGSPCGTWKYIKEKLKKDDPETYEKLPEKYRERKKPQEQPAEDPKPEPKADKKITAPLQHSGLKACGWRGQCGEYRYDKEHGYIDFYGTDGDEMSMPLAGWKLFIDELTTAAALMGVEL